MTEQELQEIRDGLAERWRFVTIARETLASYDADTLTRLLGISLGLGDLFNENQAAERDWIATWKPMLKASPWHIIVNEPERLAEVEALLDSARGLK